MGDGRRKGGRFWFQRRVSAGASAAGSCGGLVAAGLAGRDGAAGGWVVLSHAWFLREGALQPASPAAGSEASRAMSFLRKRRPARCEIQTVPSQLLFLLAFIYLV